MPLSPTADASADTAAFSALQGQYDAAANRFSVVYTMLAEAQKGGNFISEELHRKALALRQEMEDLQGESRNRYASLLDFPEGYSVPDDEDLVDGVLSQTKPSRERNPIPDMADAEMDALEGFEDK